MSEEIDARTLVRRPFLFPSPLQRYMPFEHRIEWRDGIALVAMGENSPEENFVLVVSDVVPEHVLAVGDRQFGRGTYSIVVESETNPALTAHLDQTGWHIDEDVPTMLLRPIPPLPERPSRLRIEPVRTQHQFDDFLQISETGRRWIPSLEAATDPNVCLLVGYLDDRPVATSRINVIGDLGEINGVVTDPAYRRRGYGTLMTWAAIGAGIDRGCTAIMLTATELGYPVYSKMGFVTICNYRTYMPPEESASTTSADRAHAPTGS